MKRKTILIIQGIGIFAVLLTGFVVSYNLWDDHRAGKSAALTTQILSEQIAENKQDIEENLNETTPELIEINGEFYIGMLNIPVFSLKLPINNEWDDARLNESPCRYSGDITDSLVICAHNYRSQFGRISNLSYGEKLIITDAKGNEHWYNVEFVVTLNEADIEPMINSLYDLSLFTCTLDRRHRITVRCTKIDLEYPPFPEYEIRQGQLNGNVLLMQKYLNAISSIQPSIIYLIEDSSFGPATYRAVQAFQELYELPVDGIIDSITWDKIVTIYNTLQ